MFYHDHETLNIFFQSLANEIVYITRPIDKKKIMFYNDKTANLSIDEEFQKLWRSVAVENMDDQKIEEYLEKQVSRYCKVGIVVAISIKENHQTTLKINKNNCVKDRKN